MSIFKRNMGLSPLAQAVSQFKQTIADQGSDFSNAEMTQGMLSMESMSTHQSEEFDRHTDTVEQTVRDAFEENVGLEDFQILAGSVIALAAGNPAGYMEAATDLTLSTEGSTLVSPVMGGRHGNQILSDRVSNEAFDNQELANHLPYSIAFNVQASRQDAFGEAFYPTTVVTPDRAGMRLSVQSIEVMEEVLHTTSGQVKDWKRRNLLNAVSDASVLANEATRLVPVVLKDDSNLDQFIDAALVPKRSIMIQEVAVDTAPLKPGIDVDLLGISSHPGLIGAGLMDSTDSIDAGINLDKVYLSVASDNVDDGAGGTKSVEEIFSFPVGRLPRSAFKKSQEGGSREMNLMFSGKDFMLSSTSKTDAGNDSEILAALAANHLTLRVELRITGTLDVQTGHANVFANPAKVVAVHDFDPTTDTAEVLPMTDAVAIAALTAVGDIAVKGYTVQGTRSNLNHRTRGLILDSTEYTESYEVMMGSPISVPAPTSSDRSASDLSSLITAARIATSNNAVTSLLNYAETLEAFVKDLPQFAGDVAEVEGIGRKLIQPFFERDSIDLKAVVSNISSHEKSADVKAVLIDAIREISYRMYRETNYQTAIDAVTGTSGQKPVLVIGTDPALEQHLMVAGDDRTAGIAFEHKIVSTSDVRMRGKIVFSFVRPNAQGGDVLSFGTHAWVPELTSTTAVSRRGANVRETTVQPRTTHINCLPAMGVIDVKGMEVLRSKVDMPITP